MNNPKVSLLILCLTCGIAQGYIWNDWKKPSTQAEIDKKEIDLKYQKKAAHNYAKAEKKQADLNLKQKKIELDRQKANLELERY